MSRWKPVVGIMILMAVLALAVTQIYERRLSRDLYPRYSSLRADPVGLRLLHDTVDELPRHSASRWMRRFDLLPAKPERTIVVAGLDVGSHGDGVPLYGDGRRALERVALAGGRVIIAFERMRYFAPWQIAELPDDVDLMIQEEETDAEAESKEEHDDEITGAEDVLEFLEEIQGMSLGFEVRYEYVQDDWGMARATPTALRAQLPAFLNWRTHAYLVPTVDADAAWQTLYRFGGRPVVMERSWGRGSIVVMTETYPLSNEALHTAADPAIIRWLLGSHQQLQMVETHLGVVEEPGIAALARRYGLTGALIVLGVWLLLFAWRRMALFLPAPPESRTLELTYESTAGLEALMRRSVAPDDLVAICEEEWKRTASPGDRDRVAREPFNSPVEGYNQITRSLRRH